MLEKMREIIAEQLNCEAESIQMETSFKEDFFRRASGSDNCWLCCGISEVQRCRRIKNEAAA